MILEYDIEEIKKLDKMSQEIWLDYVRDCLEDEGMSDEDIEMNLDCIKMEICDESY